MTNYNERLDEIVDTLNQFAPDQLVEEMRAQAKQAILSDLLELIGEDDIEVRGTTQNPDNPKHWTRKTANRNQLRQELRDKVKEYCE